MKIVNNKSSNKKLCDIEAGEVFLYNGTFYIRIDDVYTDNDYVINTVRLADGETFNLTEDAIVEPCDVELQIKG